eukprot:gene12674-2317_t
MASLSNLEAGLQMMLMNKFATLPSPLFTRHDLHAVPGYDRMYQLHWLSCFPPYALSYMQALTIISALDICGNLLSGTEPQAQVVLDFKGLPGIAHILLDSSCSFKHKALWALSNVAAGNANQIQQLLDADLLPAIIDSVENDTAVSRTNAVYALCNMTYHATAEQFLQLAHGHVLPTLATILTKFQEEPKILSLALDAVNNVLRNSPIDITANPTLLFPVMFQADGLVEALEELEQHHLEHISGRVLMNACCSCLSSDARDTFMAPVCQASDSLETYYPGVEDDLVPPSQ